MTITSKNQGPENLFEEGTRSYLEKKYGKKNITYFVDDDSMLVTWYRVPNTVVMRSSNSARQDAAISFANKQDGIVFTGIASENDWSGSRSVRWWRGLHLVNRSGEYAVVTMPAPRARSKVKYSTAHRKHKATGRADTGVGRATK